MLDLDELRARLASDWYDGPLMQATAKACMAELIDELAAMRLVMSDWLQEDGAQQRAVRAAAALERGKCRTVLLDAAALLREEARDLEGAAAGSRTAARYAVLSEAYRAIETFLHVEEAALAPGQQIVAFVFRPSVGLSAAMREQVGRTLDGAFEGTPWNGVPKIVLAQPGDSLELIKWPPESSHGNHAPAQ